MYQLQGKRIQHRDPKLFFETFFIDYFHMFENKLIGQTHFCEKQTHIKYAASRLFREEAPNCTNN